MKKVLKNKKIIFGFSLLLLVVTVLLFKFSLSENIEEDLRVRENTELTYYLEVSYDGVDSSGKESDADANAPTTADVRSGVIYVEDRIPEGLTFIGFETGGNKSIGAVRREDGRTCSGYVVDDAGSGDSETYVEGQPYNFHGLHYDPETRTVSFQVKSLQAGCYLTVGIKTMTPSSVDDPTTSGVTETRRDFYNTATGREGDLTVDSNTVHAWMGEENPTTHTVTYRYAANVPDNAPALSSSNPKQSNPIEYAENSVVGVRGDILLNGYTFNGWKLVSPSSISWIEEGESFTMPTTDVVFEGSFTKIPTFTVTYEITGEIPEGYAKPDDEEHYADEVVSLDILEAGATIGEYRFKGWKIESPSGITISEDKDFVMPSNDVVITGEFELIKYTVKYEFIGDEQPPSASNYLPALEEYAAGEKVTIATVTEPSGYKFLGWYYDVDENNQFIMPAENITITGEWRKLNPLIKPTIKKEITNSLNPKDNLFGVGATVSYKITVTNTANYAITDVTVVEQNDNAYFINGSNYEVTSKHVVTIPTIAANQSVEVYAEYVVTENDIGTVTNTVLLSGATASNNAELDPDGDYTASASFIVSSVASIVESSVKICNNVDNLTTDKSFTFKLKGESRRMNGISNEDFYEVGFRLKSGECKTLILNAIAYTYTLTEIVPQEYEIKSVTGAISTNGGGFTISPTQTQNLSITFTNSFGRKAFNHSNGEFVNTIKSKVAVKSLDIPLRGIDVASETNDINLTLIRYSPLMLNKIALTV